MEGRGASGRAAGAGVAQATEQVDPHAPQCTMKRDSARDRLFTPYQPKETQPHCTPCRMQHLKPRGAKLRAHGA